VQLDPPPLAQAPDAFAASHREVAQVVRGEDAVMCFGDCCDQPVDVDVHVWFDVG
jgi:hypothetical protein